MTPGKARLAVGSFVMLSAAIVINTLFMQNDPAAIAAARAASERAAAKAELQRVRRLSVDGFDRKSARKRVRRLTRAAPARKAGRNSRASVKAAGKRPTRIAELRQDAAKLLPRHEAGGQAGAATRDTVRTIQRELTQRHYQPGLVDGVPGLMTRAAIMAYENDQGMILTGEPSKALLQKIILGESYLPNRGRALLPPGARPHAAQVIRTVQQSLATLGYYHGTADGAVGEVTKRAIREFEMDHALVPSGRISGHLVAQLAKLAGQSHVASKRRH